MLLLLLLKMHEVFVVDTIHFRNERKGREETAKNQDEKRIRFKYNLRRGMIDV